MNEFIIKYDYFNHYFINNELQMNSMMNSSGAAGAIRSLPVA